jgi:hypothetical protein
VGDTRRGALKLAIRLDDHLSKTLFLDDAMSVRWGIEMSVKLGGDRRRVRTHRSRWESRSRASVCPVDAGKWYDSVDLSARCASSHYLRVVTLNLRKASLVLRQEYQNAMSVGECEDLGNLQAMLLRPLRYPGQY